ncbi:MAG TPA: hypothetical protein VJ529_04455, partial [Candidatus Bathyarchaeia archaeon]|nr:hypothetical protein [Candidatus Bathyarchaeia archaeon]
CKAFAGFLRQTRTLSLEAYIIAAVAHFFPECFLTHCSKGYFSSESIHVVQILGNREYGVVSRKI